MIFPQKLKKGDKVIVVAPSNSLSPEDFYKVEIAKKRLNALGLKVELSKNSNKRELLGSSSVESRIEDIHSAFEDKEVKMILCARGGFNSIELIDRLDYSLIKRNPKIVCGYSDITALTTAIYVKTGLVTYSGPNFKKFSLSKGQKYLTEYFVKALFDNTSFDIEPAESYTNDYIEFIKNQGFFTINRGSAEGVILGGNLSTLNLLQGTEYFPDLSNSILFVEEDSSVFGLEIFNRELESLLLQKGGDRLKALVVGRFRSPDIKLEIVSRLLKEKKELKEVPIVANVDFGHTFPRITFPIGGTARINLNSESQITIVNH